jgi:dienelactone hydrolase
VASSSGEIEQRFAADGGEPLGLWQGPLDAPAGLSDLRVRAFEYSSRGDRVPGRLLLPPRGEGPFPWVLLQHGAHGSKDAEYIDAVAGRWVRGGVAVACIDFPLHGERSNPKFRSLLLAGLGLDGSPTPAASKIVEEFVRQAVIDLKRAFDALGEVDALDAARSAYAGLSLGSIVGATFCAFDPRPRAVVLALGGGGTGSRTTDPVHHVRRIAPRPVLFVGATRDQAVPRAATEALYEAAGEPKEILWFDSGHKDLPGGALKAMWTFLCRHLEVDAGSG